MASRNMAGKSIRESGMQDLESALVNLTGSEYTLVEQKSADYDEFVKRVMGFCAKPNRKISKNKVLEIARENCGCIGLRNFYRLAEFFREETGEQLEFKVANTYGGFDKVMREVRDYLGAAIPEDATVYLVSYEKENGKMKRINDLFLNATTVNSSRMRNVSKADFPMKGGVMHLFVKEKDMSYAVSIEIGIETEEKFYDGEMHKDDCNVAIVRPLLKMDYPKKFRNVVSQRDN